MQSDQVASEEAVSAEDRALASPSGVHSDRTQPPSELDWYDRWKTHRSVGFG